MLYAPTQNSNTYHLVIATCTFYPHLIQYYAWSMAAWLMLWEWAHWSWRWAGKQPKKKEQKRRILRSNRSSSWRKTGKVTQSPLQPSLTATEGSCPEQTHKPWTTHTSSRPASDQRPPSHLCLSTHGHPASLEDQKLGGFPYGRCQAALTPSGVPRQLCWPLGGVRTTAAHSSWEQRVPGLCPCSRTTVSMFCPRHSCPCSPALSQQSWALFALSCCPQALSAAVTQSYIQHFSERAH